MKIAIVFFTYDKDAGLLNQALRGVKRLRAKYTDWQIDAYICDDANHPLEDVSTEWLRQQTTFDRQGNLNGIDCIRGMLAVHAEIFAQGGYDWVVKTDSDTYINNLDWLMGIDKDRVAQVGTHHINDFNSGSCYAFSEAGVRSMLALLEDEIIQKRCNIAYKEDVVMTRLARQAHMEVVQNENEQNEPGEKKLFNDFDTEEELPLSELQGAAAVAFKNCRWHDTLEKYIADVSRAEERMTAYADYVVNLIG